MPYEDFAALKTAREYLFEAHARHPKSPHLGLLHRQALRLLYRFKDALSLTDEQLGELAAPQGGGTPKTPEPDGD